MCSPTKHSLNENLVVIKHKVLNVLPKRIVEVFLLVRQLKPLAVESSDILLSKVLIVPVPSDAQQVVDCMQDRGISVWRFLTQAILGGDFLFALWCFDHLHLETTWVFTSPEWMLRKLEASLNPLSPLFLPSGVTNRIVELYVILVTLWV